MIKISIHRALAELKLLTSRIEKAIGEIVPSAMVQRGKKIDGHITIEEFETNARAKLKSIQDLIKRKREIKTKIVESNGITMVTIAGKEMTVADAITEKEATELKRTLISNLAVRHHRVIGAMNKHNEELEKKIQVAIEAAMGKDSVKTSPDDVEHIRKPMLESGTAQLVDPLNVTTLIENLNNELESFTSEVDSVLSESNAVTMIDISE